MEEKLTSTQQKLHEYVEKLCENGHRGTATPEEKAGADWFGEELSSLGLDVTKQQFKTPKNFAIMVFFPVLVAFIGSLFIDSSPVFASIIIAISLVLFIGEFTNKFRWYKGLLSKGNSQNVFGHYKPDEVKRTIIISAHLDSANQGLIFHPKLTENATSSGSLGPLFPIAIAICMVLFTAIVTAFGGSSWILTLINWVGVILLVLAGALMIEWMRGTPVPGANDNASGIAAVLVMAERIIKEKPKYTEYYFVGFGAEEANLVGSHEFVKEFGHRFKKESTYVINFDGIASGRPYYVTHESVMIPQRYPDQELIVTANNLVRSSASLAEVSPALIQGLTDAIPFALADFKAISIVCLEDNKVPINYHTILDKPDLMNWQHAELSLEFAGLLIKAIKV